MATLTGNTIASTYTGLLSVSGAVGAVTLESVTDGAGTATSLSLSQQKAKILLGTDSGDDFTINNGSADIVLVEGDTNDVTLLDDLIFISDSAVIKFGADGDTILTHTDGTGLTLNGTNKLCFYDASQYIRATSNSRIQISATDEIDLTATDIDINGAVDISGVASATTFEPDGDTSASDNAAIGYTASEGLILTGQGSTSDITLKNDADTTVFTVPTGTDDILFPDSAEVIFGAGSDLEIYSDGTHGIIKQKSGGILKLGTESGVAITIGHTTSETTVADNLTVDGQFKRYQGTQATTDNGTTAISAANVLTGIIQCTPDADRSKATDSASNFITTLELTDDNDSFDFSLINLATDGTSHITITAGASVTLVGCMVVSAQDLAEDAFTSGVGRFRIKRSSGSACTMFRIA